MAVRVDGGKERAGIVRDGGDYANYARQLRLIGSRNGWLSGN